MISRLRQKIHSLGIISFLIGFALMAYELVAARLLAPTIGSSIYVWTSVIGVIIALLSVGYWLGGKLADARKREIDVVALCLLAAICVVFTIIAQSALLDWIASSIDDTRLQGVIASLLLFAPTSFVLGLISPYLAKLNIKALETAGESVANLSALNSIGGIAGTFITGFILFSYIGSNETLLIVVICLLLSSWLLVPRRYVLQRVILSVALILTSVIPSQEVPGLLARIDSPSAHYEVSQLNYKGSSVTALTTGPGGIQSAIYDDNSKELVFWYTSYAARLIQAVQPERVLVLGGGAFTLPEALANRLPNTNIDVVEIDPALESISKEYFDYQDRPNIKLIFEDARSFVNTSKEPYDVIFVDVYGDSYVPFSLLTKEYGEQINKLVKPDGMVVMNAIVGQEGPCEDLLSAVDGVYRPHFPEAFWATQSNTAIKRGNYILAYTRDTSPPIQMNTLNNVESVTYKDNFMPAERLTYDCSRSNR